MASNPFLQRHLVESKVNKIMSRDLVTVAGGVTIEKASALLQSENIGALLITDPKDMLVGIVTEHDLIVKVALVPEVALSDPISSIMTVPAVTLKGSASIAKAVHVLATEKFRHLPIVHSELFPVGMISVRDIVDYLFKVTTRYPELREQRDVHGKVNQFFSLPVTELRPASAPTLTDTSTVEQAFSSLAASHLGAVLLVNSSGMLQSIFTERDFSLKMKDCGKRILSEKIRDYSTASPQVLKSADNVATAFELLSARGLRHLPVLDKHGKPTGLLNATHMLSGLADRIVSDLNQ